MWRSVMSMRDTETEEHESGGLKAVPAPSFREVTSAGAFDPTRRGGWRKTRNGHHGTLPMQKATWDDVEARLDALPEKDRAAIRDFCDERRDRYGLGPATVLRYARQLGRASVEVDAPLLASADAGGEYRRWLRERARKQKHRWYFLNTHALFLEHHAKDAAWARPPKRSGRGGHATKAKLIADKERAEVRRLRVVSAAEFGEAVARASGPMERALLYVLWDTGMRPAEVLSLRWDSVEESEGNLFLQLPPDEESYFGLKTGPRRVAIVESVAALKEWMNAHPTKRAGDPLWPGARSAVVSLSSLKYWFRRWMPGHSAKDLRHTRALRAKLDGWSEPEMRAYFGWSRTSDMPSWYGAFTESDANASILRRAGLLAEDGEGAHARVVPVACPRCGTSNVRENVYCFACGGPLRAELVERERDAASVAGRAARVEPLLRELVRDALREEREARRRGA